MILESLKMKTLGRIAFLKFLRNHLIFSNAMSEKTFDLRCPLGNTERTDMILPLQVEY